MISRLKLKEIAGCALKAFIYKPLDGRAIVALFAQKGNASYARNGLICLMQNGKIL